MVNNKKFGVALSGGGYRAAAFHLGILRKLSKLEILKDVDVVSTISGGSITGAYYCLNKDKGYGDVEASLIEILRTRNVKKSVLLSFRFLIMFIIILAYLILATYFFYKCKVCIALIMLAVLLFVLFKFQFKIFPTSDKAEQAYERYFFNNAKLPELPATPELVIGSTNLQTARPFTFSKYWMQDSTYQYLRNDEGIVEPVEFITKDFPVAKAVMASTCVPILLTPLDIEKKHFVNPARDFDRINPKLVDGGLYDNQGIHKIMQKGTYNCDIIITSDAGIRLPFEATYNNLVTLLIRTMDVFMARIKNAQMVQDVYNNSSSAKKEIAYISLSWTIEECIEGFIRNLKDDHITEALIAAHKLLPEWVKDPEEYKDDIKDHLKEIVKYDTIIKPNHKELKLAQNVETGLSPLSKVELDALIKQGEGLAEIQIRLYCPSLIK
jgi:NTE family protein